MGSMLGKHQHIDMNETILKRAVETSSTRFKILISSGVLLEQEVLDWSSLPTPFYMEVLTQERN